MQRREFITLLGGVSMWPNSGKWQRGDAQHLHAGREECSADLTK